MNTQQNTEHFDAVVIGAGQAGPSLSKDLAKAGWKTALIERQYVGGTCVNYGCTPTKTMVASAQVAHLARRAAEYGVNTGDVTVDLSQVIKRKRDIVESFRASSTKSLESSDNLELIFGEASFVDQKTISINMLSGGSTTLTADHIFINTGAQPASPAISGLDGIEYLDSTSIMELESIPEHLIVIGGGIIALEFGQMYRRFGSKVSIVERSAHLASREDEDVSEEIERIFRGEGIDLYLKTETTSVNKTGVGNITVEFSANGRKDSIQGSHLLVAAGRIPASADLNLDATGVKVDKRGFIIVNEKLETNVTGIYALGDVKPGPAFTHIAYDDYRILRTNLLEKGDVDFSGRLVPYAIFTDPQLGRVGLSEKEAKEQGLDVQVAKLPMTHVARAIESNETEGFMKALVDVKSGQILGAAILGKEGGEVMSVLQMAMLGKVPYQRIRDGVFAHPTLAESLNNLFMRL